MKHRSDHLVRLTFFITCFLLLTFSITYAQEQPQPLGLRPDAPPYALHGPYWVGTMEMDEETDFHPTKVQIWYPALNPDGEQEAVTYSGAGYGSTAPLYGRALQDAEPDRSGGPYPLVIYVHGLMGSRLVSTYLAEHLASQGFMVMAMNYADNNGTGTGVNPAMSIYTRPKDVTWQINYAEQLNSDANGNWQGMIDLEHVAVTGHSFGGYTAFAAGGARLDLTGATSWCLQYPNLSMPPEISYTTFQRFWCDFAPAIAKLAGLASVPDGVWPSWADPRVDAIIPLAPAPFFGADSMAEVTIPTLLMYGDKDHLIYSSFPLYEPYLYENLGSAVKARVVFNGAAHTIFVNACTATPVSLFWICSDSVWDMDRAHDLINHFTTAFLLDVLKGDTAAHAALAPEAVSFPGITYEAEGY